MSTKRWLDEASDADGLERSILTSGLDADPPTRAEDEVWQRVLVAVAPPLGPGPGGGAGGAGGGAVAVTKGATVATLGKGFLLGVAASVAVAGADRLRHHSFATPVEGSVAHLAAEVAPPTRALPAPPPAERAAVAPLPASVGSLELAVPGPPGALPRVGSPARGAVGPALDTLPRSSVAAPRSATRGSTAAFPISDASTPAPQSRLDEEAALLGKARAELRAGALAAAFATLEASRERISAPELYQEREALLIELLSRSGQREQARKRAHAFLERFPESPHAAAVRAFADPSR
jgi:hypothetical protein